jgi:hypothetical protein
MEASTVELTLHSDEASVLHRVLSKHVSDLQREISSSDDQERRRTLQAEDTLMRNLIARLAGDHGAIDRWADEAGASAEQPA